MPPDGTSPSAGEYIALPLGSDDSRPAIRRIHDAHPGMGRRFHDIFVELMVRQGPLRASQRELIAAVVSSENGCHY